MESIPYWLLIVLIVAAVAAGLWIGHRAGELAPADKGGARKTIGARVRELGTKSVISLWKWNRRRKAKADEKPE